VAEVWTPPAFDDVSTGELVTASQINALGNSLRFLKRIAYVEFTSNVSVTATSEGTANQIVSAGAITYENVPHLIEFFAPVVQPVGGVLLRFMLEDSTTVLGQIARKQLAASEESEVYGVRRLTPSAASHTYNVRAWTTSGTATVVAGSGGSGTALPGFIRITRVPT
jgi:hypothetical protein